LNGTGNVKGIILSEEKTHIKEIHIAPGSGGNLTPFGNSARSAASESIAPPRCIRLLAMTPSGRPSTRMNAVIMP